MAQTHTLTLPDGRELRYRISGAKAGSAVFILHGTPGSLSKFTAADAAAIDLGLTLVTPDRWGYGASDRHRTPSLTAWTQDMAALADALGIADFAVVGISGGGPYAAATAAVLARRVTALGLVSPVGEIVGAADIPKLSAMHQFCFRVLPRLPTVIAAIFGLFAWGLRVAPKIAMRIAMCNVPAADRHLLANADIYQRLIDMFRQGLHLGSSGPVTDLVLFSKAWDFSLHDITAPAKLWIGTADTNVPQAAAMALAQRIPGCQLEILQDTGHLWVMAHERDVLAWIAATAADKHR
jgi:pimeloyl-ACP methyl ester carboxylesterase